MSALRQYKDDARLTFATYLAKRNLKLTDQRLLILDIFLDKEGHVTPKEMVEAARGQDGSVSQATIYRTMKLLAESGLARETLFDDGVMRYESIRGDHHMHAHLFCTVCGQEREVADPRLVEVLTNLCRDVGYNVEDFKLFLYGSCPTCARRKLS